MIECSIKLADGSRYDTVREESIFEDPAFLIGLKYVRVEQDSNTSVYINQEQIISITEKEI